MEKAYTEELVVAWSENLLVVHVLYAQAAAEVLVVDDSGLFHHRNVLYHHPIQEIVVGKILLPMCVHSDLGIRESACKKGRPGFKSQLGNSRFAYLKHYIGIGRGLSYFWIGFVS